MRTKILQLLLIACMILSLTACGSYGFKGDDNDRDKDSQSNINNSINNLDQNKTVSDIIKKICKEKPCTDILLLKPVDERKIVGTNTLSSYVCEDYLYYGFSGLGKKSGIYKMDLKEESLDVTKIMYTEPFDLGVLPTDNSGDILFQAGYDFQEGYGFTGWMEACYYLEDPYGYWAMPFGGSTNYFKGACVIGNYAYTVADGYSILRYPINSSSLGEGYVTVFESDSVLKIVGCYDDETFLVYIEDDDNYVLFDKNGKQLKELTYLNQYDKIFTFGRNKEIAIVRTDDELENRKYGYLLEDGTFIEDEFVEQLFVGRDDFHVDYNYNDFFVDMDFNKGTVYYITSGGNIRSRSLITGEDKFIINDKNADGLMFCTEEHIYYANYLSNGELAIYRCKIDGTEKENCTSLMLWKE